jgi:hypothetical protein
MDYLEDLNIKEMYKYQINQLDSKEYKEYLHYLHTYFLKEHKKEIYDKDFIDSQYILIDKKNPKKKISITPSQFINIHKLYIDLKNYSDELLIQIKNIIESKNNISEEDRINFENFKKKYLSYAEKIKDIDEINSHYYKELEKLLNIKIEKSNQLIKYYQKRNDIYNQIKGMIKENIKNNLIKIFKENKKKIPSANELNKIAKKYDVSSNEIEKWFQWIESVYLYILAKEEILLIDNQINKHQQDFDINTHYMIIKKCIVNIY